MHDPDIEVLLREKRWVFSQKDVRALPAAELRLDAEFVRRFPKLTRLMRLARVTDFRTSRKKVVRSQRRDGLFPSEEVTYRLFAWTIPDGHVVAWPVSPYESIAVPDRTTISEDHRLILQNLGGINYIGAIAGDSELDEENLNFAANQDFVFGLDAPVLDTKLWIKGYDHDFKSGGPDVTIAPYVDFHAPEWVCFAKEANGNSLLYDSKTDKVLLFSGDDCFDYVKPSDDYRWQCHSGSYKRDYLLRIEGVVTLRDWAEKLAEQWLAAVEGGLRQGARAFD